MDAYKDEIFGPVLGVTRVETYDEAVRLVNENPYGNGVAIFTRDGGVARQFQFDVAGRHGRRSTSRSRCRSRTTRSAAGRASLFGDRHIYGPEGIDFYTRGKVVTVALARPGHLEGRPGLPADALMASLARRERGARRAVVRRGSRESVVLARGSSRTRRTRC